MGDLRDWLSAQQIRVRAARGRLGGRWHRVYHHHVRKSGGTSLNAAFWALAGLDLAALGRHRRARGRGLTIVRHDRTRIAAGRWFFASAHVPAYRVTLPPGTFTITILRDPVARLRSLYRYLLWARDDPAAPAREPYHATLAREFAWLGRDFTDFLDRLPPTQLQRHLATFSATGDVDEATGRLAALDAVCFTESLDADVARLGRRLGLALRPGRERQVGPDVVLTDAERAAARERVACEVRLLAQVRAARRP